MYPRVSQKAGKFFTGYRTTRFSTSTTLHGVNQSYNIVFATTWEKGIVVLSNNRNLPFVYRQLKTWGVTLVTLKAVFLNSRAAARYRALASTIPGRERPEETTVCYKISLVKLITNLNVILYLSTWHTVYISVLILFMIIP